MDTYIKNSGITKTIIHSNNRNNVSEINWDANYDGEVVDISLDVDSNGDKGHIELQLNNEELSHILNIPSEKGSLDERLMNDFIIKKRKKKSNMTNIYTHISSPNSNGKLLMPLKVKSRKKIKKSNKSNKSNKLNYYSLGKSRRKNSKTL